jgi:orotate phosphoribosyltransferase
MISTAHDDVIALMPARRGHFLLESGHHGDLWLDLELLCLSPGPVRRLAARVAARLAPYEVDAVCGPLVEGAFVTLMVAEALGVPFTYAERFRIRSATRCSRSTIASPARCEHAYATSEWPS